MGALGEGAGVATVAVLFSGVLVLHRTFPCLVSNVDLAQIFIFKIVSLGGWPGGGGLT